MRLLLLTEEMDGNIHITRFYHQIELNLIYQLNILLLLVIALIYLI